MYTNKSCCIANYDYNKFKFDYMMKLIVTLMIQVNINNLVGHSPAWIH